MSILVAEYHESYIFVRLDYVRDDINIPHAEERRKPPLLSALSALLVLFVD